MTLPVLFIGGLDSSTGAGLLRDAATAAALRQPCRVAATAVTAQSDCRLAGLQPVTPEILTAQIEVATETGISAVKTGMLANAALVAAVAANLPPVPLVVDPVLLTSSGHALLTEDGIEALLSLLLPRTTLLTPNLPELARLARHLGLRSTTPEPQVVSALLASGCGAVLVKGGHADDAEFSADRLYRRDQPVVQLRSRRQARSLRGTGCQLASAIAVGLAAGLSLDQATARGKAMLTRRFRRGV